ncbi:hypothetical protein [Nocardia higoensis]|uniref:hypothetical protein n=1 Tax=Nocardia higoensis TaxID=228599 RepID=UPI0003108680|nr:hypothetical protein [Nocardia higoensis]
MADAAYVVLIFATFLACALVLRGLNGRATDSRAVEDGVLDGQGPYGRAHGDEEPGR